MDYIFIRAWHRMSGSFDYYIEALVEKAKAEKAPETAVYFSRDRKRWITIEECVPGTQDRVKAYIKKYFKIDV